MSTQPINFPFGVGLKTLTAAACITLSSLAFILCETSGKDQQAGAASATPLPEFDTGGVSIDFSKSAPEPVTTVGENKGVTVRLIPFSFLDNVYCLSSGDPGILMLACRNEKDDKIEKPFVFLELPEKVDMLAARTALAVKEKKETTRDGAKYIQYKIDVNRMKHTFAKNSYSTWNGLAFLLRTSLPAGGKFSARYWYEDGAYKTEPRSFSIRVLPSVKGKTPKLFETGTIFATEANYDSEDSANAFASFYAGLGFNAIHGGSSSNVLKALANKGVKRYCQPYWLCNGYRLGQAPKPDTAKFQMPDGAYYQEGGFDAICPVEVYTEGDYFKEQIVKPLRKILVEDRSADGIMPNWEPYMFDWKGCFCPKCKKEFVTYSGLPAEEVDKLWPGKIIVAHREKWVAFRSWQHGKMMATLEKAINALGKEAGIESHFIPEIAWSSLTEKRNPESGQHNPLDFIEKLPVVEPWGPYLFHAFTRPYEYQTGSHLITYAAAKDIQDFIAQKVKPPAKRPKLIAFPHGFQGNDWVTEPEALAFEYLCFFLHRWNGALAYYFPRGYDARYWNALAKINTLIADYENFVFKGRPLSDFTITAETPIPAIIPEYALQKNTSNVQGVGYEYDGKRMFAIGDFWQKADAFVRLSVTGLSKDQTYVLRQPQMNCHFTNKSGETALTEQDLRDGLLVHVGALRFSFFILEPYVAGADYGRAVTPAEINSFKEKRLPDIIKAIAFENDYKANAAKKTAEETKIPDYSQKIKPLSKGRLSCAAEKPSGEETLCAAVSNGNDRLVIDPAVGGRLRSWKHKGTELVLQDPKLGLAVDAFWWPAGAASIILSPYEVDKQELADGVLTLAMSRKLILNDNQWLAGITIIKTYRISEKDGGVAVTTEIKNTTDREIELSFRYHDMLSFLEVKDAKSGWVVMKNGATDQKFERLFMIKLYRYAAEPDKELEKAFKMDSIQQVTDSKAEFAAPWTSSKLSVDIQNKKDLHCFIFWDSGKQAAATFEPLYKRVKLAPGQSWQGGMSIRVIE